MIGSTSSRTQPRFSRPPHDLRRKCAVWVDTDTPATGTPEIRSLTLDAANSMTTELPPTRPEVNTRAKYATVAASRHQHSPAVKETGIERRVRRYLEPPAWNPSNAKHQAISSSDTASRSPSDHRNIFPTGITPTRTR